MKKICLDLGLVNILQNHHDTEDTPTYVSGTTRIDYALATPHVAAACTSCGYEPFQYRFPGDHRGMFLDFNTNALFDSAMGASMTSRVPPLHYQLNLSPWHKKIPNYGATYCIDLAELSNLRRANTTQSPTSLLLLAHPFYKAAKLAPISASLLAIAPPP
jgi:hypothetical protein